MQTQDEKHRVESYSVAGTFPAKLLKVWPMNKDGRIVPYHAQLYPTNACDLSCSFCSCADRKNTVRMAWNEMEDLLGTLAYLGTRAVTISGGGEPMLYPHLDETIAAANDLGLVVGLVSNGNLLHRLKSKGVTWLRVSRSDEMDASDEYYERMSVSVKAHPEIDWAFSYVLTAKPDMARLRKAVRFAGAHGFTHVRIVSDLLDLDRVPDMDGVMEEIEGLPGSDLVIYQGRKVYAKGREKCLISLLKPVIAADGYLYPCCGAQYAIEEAPRDVNERMRLGHWRDMVRLWENGENFNGSICSRCYYDQYNAALEIMTEPVNHREFV